MYGTVFDIKEFSVYDGPGVRVTVFLKGCPLRCQWCHNPEGLSAKPQVMVSSACEMCGRCAVNGCEMAEGGECTGCGKCVGICPNGYRKISGEIYSADNLAEKINSYKPFFTDGGGVTFSGGEPTFQGEFLCEALEKSEVHRAVQTCGYCSEDVFKRVLERVDYMLFDIKHTDPVMHKKYTGVDNAPILRNLELLKKSGKPFTARIPLIEGVNDGNENLSETAKLLSGAKGLERAELLPYNGAAGAKYSMIGKEYPFKFRAPEKVDISVFEKYGIAARVL